jgi:SAM-dependent methyltransferase
MRRFWDRRADENALFFVDNRLDYHDPDTRRFWDEGRRDLDKLLEVADVRLRPGDVVVEIGCGVGRLTRPLAERVKAVQALDISARMLELARSYNPRLANVEWLHGDGRSLAPIGSGTADACISHVVFQHISDPSVTLAYVHEMGRVLKPGGWAAFQVSNDPEVHRRRLDLARTLRSLARRAPRGQSHPDWRGANTDLEELRAAAVEAGMDTERVVGEGTQFCVVRLRAAAEGGRPG